MSSFLLYTLVFSGAALVAALILAINGKRTDGNIFNPLGSAFWRPKQLPKDEWEEWGKY